MNVADLCARTERLCESITEADFGGRPVYCVAQSSIEAGFGLAESCDGYTAPALDLILRGELGDRWRGRGPCFVVNDVVLGRDEEFDDTLELRFTGIALHELAHCVQRLDLWRDRPDLSDSAKVASARLEYAEAFNRPAPEIATVADARTRYVSGHDADFLRIVLHLRYRAERIGVKVGCCLVVDHDSYGLTPPRYYEAALGGESEFALGVPFTEIIATDSPVAFSDLWADDLAQGQQPSVRR